jgi:DNA replication protein DnaC
MTRRKALVFEKVPGYKDACSEMINLSMKAAMSLIDGEDANVKEELHKKIVYYSGEKERLLKEAGYPADYLDVPYECPLCRDTGYINNEKCQCFVKLEVQTHYDTSHMKEWLEDNNFDELREDFYEGQELENFRSAVKECRSLIEDFETDRRGLLLYGNVGTGKSFLSGCVAKELLDRGKTVVYYGAAELFSLISEKAFAESKDELRLFMEMLYDCDLLIVDDLGTEMTTAFVQSALYQIINGRLLAGKQTIINTNLPPAELGRRYSPQILSRIEGEYEILPFFGEDIRRLKRQRG